MKSTEWYVQQGDKLLEIEELNEEQCLDYLQKNRPPYSRLLILVSRLVGIIRELKSKCDASWKLESADSRPIELHSTNDDMSLPTEDKSWVEKDDAVETE